MKIMSLRSKTLRFWGIMDIISLTSYFIFSILNNRVPIFSDIKGIISTINSYGIDGAALYGAYILVVCDILILVSLIFSANYFLRGTSAPLTFITVQEALRFITLKCSLAFIPLILHLTTASMVWLNVSLFIFSEIVKVGTLMWCRKQPQSHTL